MNALTIFADALDNRHDILPEFRGRIRKAIEQHDFEYHSSYRTQFGSTRQRFYYCKRCKCICYIKYDKWFARPFKLIKHNASINYYVNNDFTIDLEYNSEPFDCNRILMSKVLK